MEIMDDNYFKSRTEIKKYLINTMKMFPANAIDIAGGSKDTYLYLAVKDKLYKHRIGGQPTYITKEDVDRSIRSFLSTPKVPVK